MPQAVVCHKIGPFKESVHIIDVPAKSPGKGEAVVQVLSSGIALPMGLIVEGRHAVHKDPPYVLGNEVCGRVTKAGEGCNLKVGSIVFGRSGGIEGSGLDYGGFQEETLVDQSSVYTAPEGIDPHALAGLWGNYGTTYHALKDIAKLQPGERLCILGASGGIGFAGIELGKAMGATVVACASTAEKLKECKVAGADVCIEYSSPGFKERIRKEAGGPLDVVYDPVGGEYAEPALRALGFGGRFLVCGFAAGGDDPPSAIPKIALNLALLNERKIQGVFYGPWADLHPEEDRRNMQEMIDMMASKKFTPRTPMVFPLDKYGEAMDMILARKVVGKICIAPSGSGAKL